MLLVRLRKHKHKNCCPDVHDVSQLSSGHKAVLRSTFFLLAVSAYVAVVSVQRSCRGVGLAAMVLRIECIDCYVNQVQQGLADITVSVRILFKWGRKYKWLFQRLHFPAPVG